MLVDTHAHLETVDDLEGVLENAKDAGVSKIITIGTSIKASKKCVQIAEQRRTGTQIYATVGIHPKDGRGDIESFGLYRCINTLKQIAKSSKKVVGIGETGLDIRRTTNNGQLTTDPTSSSLTRLRGTSKEKKFQRELFEAHIKLAADLDLPLVIHCRNAWNEIFSLLTTNYGLRTKIGGVFHSFTGDWQTAKRVLD